MELSIIIPMYNEEENVNFTIEEIDKTMKNFNKDWEMVVVNDGSTDNTLQKLKELQPKYNNLKIVSYYPNIGRGKALREGFKNATGKYIISIDADLSYSPDHILKIYNTLKENPHIDVVLGSVYMKGGKAIDVPFKRLLISKLGNIFLRFFFSHNIKTLTCVLRGYKKEVLDSIELESDGKNIHLEILAKLLTLGYKIKEIPAILKYRKKGTSKFKFKKTAISHILFSFYQKPIIIFIIIGLILIFLSTIIAIFFIKKYLNINNFSFYLSIISISFLLYIGLNFILLGIISTLILNSRTEIYKIHRTLLKFLKEKNEEE